MEKIKELALKLKALAERGVGGEKINAENMLQKLMKKHQLNAEDIESESKEIELITSKSKYEYIVHIIIQSVVGECKLYKALYKNTGKKVKYKIGVKCTKSEFVEIQAKVDFYCHAFEEELQYFEFAFLERNNIRPRTYNPEFDVNRKQLSYEECRKVISLKNGIDTHHFYNQIGK